MKYRNLYISWGVLYGLCAVLGFLDRTDRAVDILCRGAGILFFLPPVRILIRAGRENAAVHIRRVRNLALGWLGATVVGICANVACVGGSQTLGTVLYALLTVVCAPLVSSGSFVIPIFLWSLILTAARSMEKSRK